MKWLRIDRLMADADDIEPITDEDYLAEKGETKQKYSDKFSEPKRCDFCGELFCKYCDQCPICNEEHNDECEGD